ncbi:MAG: hypothetical protein ABIN66_02240 [candidate division WOR-3 bacterium]
MRSKAFLFWFLPIFVALWAIANLLVLQTWPNILAFGDESWFSDVAWRFARSLRLANTIFPFTSFEKGLGVPAETIYYGVLAAFFRALGPGLFQARLLSLISATSAILILGYRLRDNMAWIPVALSPSLLLAAHTARPEALGLMLILTCILSALSDSWVILALLCGASAFISPIVGFWAGSAFLAWLVLPGLWRKKLWASGLLLLSFLAWLGITALISGPWLLTPEVSDSYYVPVLRSANPIFLLKAILKKTYWPHILGFRDPVITLMFAVGLISIPVRRFRLQKEDNFAWLFLVFGIILSGLGISRTPDYYLVYLLPPAVLLGSLALKHLRTAHSALITSAIALAGLGKTILCVVALPASDPPSRLTALRENIPQDAVVIGPTNLWYVLYDRKLAVPFFGRFTNREEFLALVDSISPELAIFYDSDTSGWLWERVSEPEPVKVIPFRGYMISGASGSPVPVQEIRLYRLRCGAAEGTKQDDAPSIHGRSALAPTPWPSSTLSETESP